MNTNSKTPALYKKITSRSCMKAKAILYAISILLLSFSCTDEKKAEADKYFHEGEQKIIARDFTAAEADFSKAIALDPERYTPYHGRGEVRILLGKKEDGLHDLATAMKLMEKHHNLEDPQYKAAYDAIKLKHQSLGGK
ncbi:MAG: hypothetical protein ACXWDO_13095 [Bacteroidia bacterium]